mgnify:CR=1 FL=1
MSKKEAPRKVADNESLAVGRMVRTSPQKLNLVAQSIRGKDVNAALMELTFSQRRIAKEVKKVLQSAVGNAEENHGLDIDNMFVAEASVGKHMVLKRWKARARGRVGRIVKPFSRIRIVLREREEAA